MDTPRPAFLLDHAALAQPRAAVLAMRDTLRTLEDYLRRLQREREDVDPHGTVAAYEPWRQLERAGHDEVQRLRATVDRLLLICTNLETAMHKTARDDAETEAWALYAPGQVPSA